METVAERLKAKLATLTPEQIIPRAYAISIPKEVKMKLVDDDIYKKTGKFEAKSNKKRQKSCSLQ